MDSLQEAYREYCKHITNKGKYNREIYVDVALAKELVKFDKKILKLNNVVFIGNSEAIKIISDYLDN